MTTKITRHNAINAMLEAAWYHSGVPIFPDSLARRVREDMTRAFDALEPYIQQRIDDAMKIKNQGASGYYDKLMRISEDENHGG